MSAFSRRRSGETTRKIPSRRTGQRVRAGLRLEQLEPRRVLAGTMVKDIYPGVVGSDIEEMTDVDGTLFFRAKSGEPPFYTVWKSDGSAFGTKSTSDVYYPHSLTALGDTLFFQATAPGLWSLSRDANSSREVLSQNDVTYLEDSTASGGYLYLVVQPAYFTGSQLWRVDAAGQSEQVVTVGPFDNLTDANGRLFFTRFDNTKGWQLWKTDGTQQSTQLLGDVNLNGTGDTPGLTSVNGTVFFPGDDLAGRELWKSDGTVAGTGLVKNIGPGLSSSNPTELTNVNGTLFFAATNVVNGVELWKSNGTNAGTMLVKDINIGEGGSSPSGLVNVGGTLYFAADDGVHGSELWKSDGTPDGTVMVADVYLGAQGSSPFNITNVDGTIFFMALDDDYGIELWKTDGTAAGTMMVQNHQAAAQVVFDTHALMAQANGTLYFTADDRVHGKELWALQALRPSAGGGYSVPENGSVLLTAAASTCDPGSTITAYDWDFDYDGTSFDADVTSTFPTATFDAFGIDGPAVRTVAVRIHDELGRSSIATAPVTITNVAPTASISGPAVGVRGQTLIHWLSAFDPSEADMAAGFTYKVDFGDNSGWGTITPTPDNGTGDVTVSRLYTKAGTYTIRVTATDTSGAASPVATFPVTIAVAAVRPDPADPDVNHLYVGGTTAADTIRINPGPTAGKIRVWIGTTVVGTYAKPNGRVIVFGQPGDDTITVFPTLAVPAELHGDDGADRLNGGAARDILLGGKGADQLNGGAADDILVAGTTAYDTDIGAWSGIFDEWSSSGTYAAKLANLLAGTGLNDPYLLKGAAGATVFNDSAIDSLTGGAGTDAYFTSAGDTVSDLAKGETNTSIVGPAMAMAKFFAAAGSQPSPSVPTKSSAITSLKAKIFSALGQ